MLFELINYFPQPVKAMIIADRRQNTEDIVNMWMDALRDCRMLNTGVESCIRHINSLLSEYPAYIAGETKNTEEDY